MSIVKGSDIGTTIDVASLSEILNDHPNGGYVYIAKYEDNDGAVTNQTLRLCPTSEQRGAGYISAKVSDLQKVNSAILTIQAGEDPFKNPIRIKRSAKFATSDHKDYRGENNPVEVAPQTKKACVLMNLDYPIPFSDSRILTALLDIKRSIVAPRETTTDYQQEGEKGLFTLDQNGGISLYLREVYQVSSELAKDENGEIISGYKTKCTSEPVAIKKAIGKALNLRRDSYRAFKLAVGKFESIRIAKKVLTMDNENEVAVIDPETARDWLGIEVPDEIKAELQAYANQPVMA